MLPDRGFNPAANTPETEAPDVRFVTPPSGGAKLCNTMERVDAGAGPAVRPYTMTGQNAQSSTATLVTVPKKAGKRGRTRDGHVAFLTNIELDDRRKLSGHVPKTYRIRS